MTYKAWLRRHLRGSRWPDRASIISVVWDDATYAQEVEDSGLARATTVGIVVEATPEYVKTASEFFADKSVRDVTTIPSGMIVGVHSLGESNVLDTTTPKVAKRR